MTRQSPSAPGLPAASPQQSTRVPLAAVPSGPVPVPDVVAGMLRRGERCTAVWRNEAGGLTFRLGAGTAHDRHVKWQPAGTPDPGEPTLADEEVRLQWAGRYVRVPVILDAGTHQDGSWLVTETIDAFSAVDPRWVAEPRRAVAAIGEGLRMLHEALPRTECPFVQAPWSAGRTDAPPVDVAVVCHGDACAPNTLIDDAGRAVAHVDLGGLGVADRWADLAVASLSLGWNYGPGWEPLFFDAYGVSPDPERIAYYRARWNSGS